jgi:anti-sigma B factor antagonist
VLDVHTCLIAVEGDLDLATTPSLKQILDEAIEAGSRLVLDLSLTAFLDSTALSVLLDTTRRLGGDLRMAIVCTRPDLLRIFEYSGLEAAFAIFATLDEALSYVREDTAWVS